MIDSKIFISSIMALLLLFVLSHSKKESSAQKAENFSLIPPKVSNISVHRNSEWEGLTIVMDYDLPKNLVPVVSDSTIEIFIPNSPDRSPLFPTAHSTFSKGVAWEEGRLVVYIKANSNPALIISKNQIILQKEVEPGKLETWLVSPTGLKSSKYFLPSYEPLALSSSDFAKSFKEKNQRKELSLAQSMQVKRSDASYIVTEDISSLFPGPSEGKPLEALEFGDRLKVLSRHTPFYKVRYHGREGYMYQRDIMLEAELTTTQRDKLRTLRKETPGGVDSVAIKFGWKDNDNIVYSSYGFRDPFVEVKSMENDSLNIDNLTLVGIFYENQKPMVLLSNNKADGLSHTFHEGDSIKNGKVIKISETEVLFLLQEYGVSRRYTMKLPDRFGGNK
ncbi:MAG: pilus assembly protein PilP [Fibromonadaceae bacterium]|jgi:hypothetical protein|nr:pilus assembly protein PilP [Fibromonadaceae bacterium]